MDLLHFVLFGIVLTLLVFVVFFSYRYHSQYNEMLYLRDENARMETYILPGGAVW